MTISNPDHIISGNRTRLDGERVWIGPGGMEKDLAHFLKCDSSLEELWRVNLAQKIKNNNIFDKQVLVVPGYSTNPFLFKLLGARRVYAVDSDPVSISWMEGLRDYFNYENIGTFLTTAAILNKKAEDEILEKMGLKTDATYSSFAEGYVVDKLCEAVKNSRPTAPLEGIEFVQGSLGNAEPGKTLRDVLPTDTKFDFIYVPYLFGIDKGIEESAAIELAFAELWQLAAPFGVVMIAPFSGSKPEPISKYLSKENPELFWNLATLLPDGKFTVQTETTIKAGNITSVFLNVVKAVAGC